MAYSSELPCEDPSDAASHNFGPNILGNRAPYRDSARRTEKYNQKHTVDDEYNKIEMVRVSASSYDFQGHGSRIIPWRFFLDDHGIKTMRNMFVRVSHDSQGA